ncbi:MAG: serine hydrolase [Bacteroidetes bacterium]|nr:serine hydrolase [Bacteroidota bacterium]
MLLLASPLQKKIILLVLISIAATLAVSAMVVLNSPGESQSTEPVPVSSFSSVEQQPLPEYPTLKATSQVNIDTLMANLSPRQKIAQLMIVWAHGQYQSADSERFEYLERLVTEEQIGGLMFSRGNIYDQAVLTNRLQSLARVPLWITQDMEFGAAMRIQGTTRITPAMGITASGMELNAWHKGRITALEAKAVGVHQIFAPVVDINNNAANPVINIRSFSEDPVVVARYADAFIHGVQSTGLMATAKHFPGHGDTNVDSHHALPVIRHGWQRLLEVELLPFRSAIHAGVGSVMSAHIAFPELAEEPSRPGTLSAAMLNGVLRDSLGFTGMIITDALEMRGISAHYSPGEAVVMALNAGADVLLAPRDALQALDEAEQAIQEGRLDIGVVDKALLRFLSIKRNHGLFEAEAIDVESIASVINNREFRATSDKIARQSITLLKNHRNILPLPTNRQRIHVIAVSNTRDDQAAATITRFVRQYNTNTTSDGIDTRSTREDVIRAVRNARAADVVILALPTGVGARYANSHPAMQHGLLRQLSQAATPVIAGVFGNPYVLPIADFADVKIMGWAATDTQYEAFTHSIFGASAISGRLPVTINDRYKNGHGYYLPQTILRSDLPEAAGMSSDRLRSIETIINNAIADSVFPGAAVAVVRDGVLVYQGSFGFHTYERRTRVQQDDIFDLASVSKVMGTTLATMRMIDENRLQLDTRIAAYFPSFTYGGKEEITVRHLLEHTSGLPAFRVYVDSIRTRDALVEAILNEPLINPPGQVYVYSDLGMITLALLIEHITGTDLDSFLQETFYRPLGLEHTMYNPHRKGAAFISRILPTEKDTVFRNAEIRGFVHDERAYYLNGIAGHAGLFSSAPDLAVLVQMLLNNGAYGGMSFLTGETIAMFTSRQPPLNRRGLGFDLRSLEGFTSAGSYSSSETFGHLGFTGTSFWIDPETKTGVILLTNRTYPYRGQTGGIARIRAAVSDAVFSSYMN